MQGSKQDDGGLYTLTQGRVAVIAGFVHKLALVEPVGRLVTASAEHGCVQGSTAREQRRAVGGAPLSG